MTTSAHNNNGAAPTAKTSTPTSTPATQALPRMAYSVEETALIVGRSKVSIYRLIKRGVLKASNALRTKMIPASEIERFLNETLQAC